MTLPAAATKVLYDGDGSTTQFSITFEYQDIDHVEVYLRDETDPENITETLQVIGALNDYTQSIDGMTGLPIDEITFTTAPASTQKVLLRRIVPVAQEELSTSPNVAIPNMTFEDTLDYLAMIDQQQQEELDRTLKLKLSSSATPPTLPDPVATELLRWNTDGTDLENISPADLTISIGDLTPVQITSPANGEVLAFDGTNWTNQIQVATAAAVTVSAITNLTATDAQAALAEHQGDIDTLQTDVAAAQADATQGITDAATAQAAADAAQTDATQALADAATAQTTADGKADAGANADITSMSGITGNIGTVEQIETANQGVDPFPPVAGHSLVYTKAGPKIFARDTNGVKEFASLNGSQEFSSKTFSDSVTIAEQASSPTTPGAGYQSIYPKSDGKWYTLDDAGVETEVGSGSGGSGSGVGGINAITNYDAETDTTGWAAYADAAGTSPVDGTGVTPTVTWTRSTTSPLRGAGSFLLTKDAANRQGEGASYDFTVDSADQAKQLTISADYAIDSGTYATGDVTVWIYDVTNSTLIQPDNYQIANVGVTSKHIARFQSAYNSTSYRLIFHVASTSASAYTLKLDNITVGPQVQEYGAPVTDWQSYTPTYSGVNLGTGGTASGKWRRVGDSMEVQFALTSGTSPSASGTVYVNLPSGYSIDTAKLPAATVENLGSAQYVDASATAETRLLQVAYSTTTRVRFINHTNSSSAEFGSSTSASVFNAASEVLTASFKVPILGWSSSLPLAQNTSEGRVVALRAVKSGATSSANDTKTDVVFTSLTAPSFDKFGALNTSTGEVTVKVPGVYWIGSTATFAANSTGTRSLFIFVTPVTGSTYTVYLNEQNNNSASRDGSVNGSAILDLQAGDKIKIQGSQTSGGSLNINSGYLNMFMIPGNSGAALAGETVKARYKGTATKSLTAGQVAIYDFDTKTFDNHGLVTTGTSWKFTAGTASTLSVKASVLMSSTSVAAGDTFRLWIYKNGSAYSAIGEARATAAGQFVKVSGADDIELLATDYIDIRVENTTSGTRSVHNDSGYNYVSITRTGNY